METTARFSRDMRLSCRSDFDYVFSAPEQRSSDGYFTVLGRCCAAQKKFSRLGIVVAKRQIARAHERNRVKRLVRELFRQQAQQPVYRDVVVLVKSSSEQASNQQLYQSIIKHLRKMRQ